MNKLVGTSVIRFDLPFMIKLPDGEYDFNSDGIYASIDLKRTRSPADMPGLPIGVSFPNHAYIEGDRWGRFNYTKIIIKFHHPIFIKPSVLFPDYLISKSVDIINRLLLVCRGVKGDHYVRIIDSDIFTYEVLYFDPNGTRLDESVFVAGGGHLTIGMGTDEPKVEHLSLIKRILSTNARLPLYQDLIYDAWDYHFYRNYRASVIESETAFEVFIDNLIIAEYRRLKKSEAKIAKILEGGLINLLEYHIKKVSGLDFSATTEYDTWKNDTYLLRNNVVHNALSVSDNQSKKCLTTVVDTINFLTSKIRGNTGHA